MNAVLVATEQWGHNLYGICIFMYILLIFKIFVHHTIRKCKKMAGQNTFQILLLNDTNMIGEH